MAKELEDKIYNKNKRKFHFSGHLTIKWIKIRLVCLQNVKIFTLAIRDLKSKSISQGWSQESTRMNSV